MDSWLNLLPIPEQKKLRKRLRSPHEYAESRADVQGPEELQADMEKNHILAELRFQLETERPLQEALKSKIQEDLKLNGMEALIDGALDAQVLEAGDFEVKMISNEETGEDALAVLPHGNPKEALPIKQTFAEQYVAQFSQGV